MFLRADSLEIEYGIDRRIAKFFVDREPPGDNLYWKDKLLYLRPQPGYIFIPLIIDLYYRSGIAIEKLLSEDYVGAIERVCHYAAQQEFGIITHTDAVNKCIEFLKGCLSSEIFIAELLHYSEGVTNEISKMAVPFKALHRADLFLFSLPVLDVELEKQFQLAKTWFALISILLLLDDAEDYLEDKEKGEENAFIESGSSKEGFEKIKEMVANNLDHLAKINSCMADALHMKLTSIVDKPGIKEYLNA
jgi:hypothetical protein